MNTHINPQLEHPRQCTQAKDDSKADPDTVVAAHCT